MTAGSGRSGPLYRHTQFGAATAGPALAAAVVLAAAGLRAGAPRILLAAAAAAALAAWLFGSLTVEIDEERLSVRFGPGIVRRRIPLSSIRAARPVRNRWYYGWGIRLTPHGWLFNVSGLRAVELEFHSGRRFRIGTDEPERLVAALESATGRSMAGDAPS